jgi:DNA invertase Pin-like site-specific DNA recombinase
LAQGDTWYATRLLPTVDILEPHREGTALARAAGKYKGRKAALTAGQDDELRVRLAAGESVTALVGDFAIRRQTVYNYAA